MSAPIPNGQLLAARILSGEMPESDCQYFSDDEWREEAEAALDHGDFSQLLAMVEHEHAMDDFDDRCLRYEMRTGKEWDTGPLWDEAPRWGSFLRSTAGMV